jgi:microcompartment protein CcmL/EutN
LFVTLKVGTVETETVCDGETALGDVAGLVTEVTLATEDGVEAAEAGFWQETRLMTAKSDKKLTHDFFIEFLLG